MGGDLAKEAEGPGLKAPFTALPRKRQGSFGLSESLLDLVGQDERLPPAAATRSEWKSPNPLDSWSFIPCCSDERPSATPP